MEMEPMKGGPPWEDGPPPAEDLPSKGTTNCDEDEDDCFCC